MIQDHNEQLDPLSTPVVTFSNIPLDPEPEPEPEDNTAPDVMVVGVQFKKGGKEYFFDPNTLEIDAGTPVIIETSRGLEYGVASSGNHMVPAGNIVGTLRPVIRIATKEDEETRRSFKEKEPQAFAICQEKITEHNLDMKLVSAEYSFDGTKILFYFTADGRIDFRDLVKDLAAIFRTRIELRQIGVRDKAKMVGGLGICGRPFCCKQFLEDFQPVSIKMAKTQNLSLNPTKISGACGRLMCCLKYEQDTYESLLKTSPKQDSLVNTCDGLGTVSEVSVLKQTVKVKFLNDSSTAKVFNNSDIVVIRNGKAKKTDPPIPLDIPPLPKKEVVESSPSYMEQDMMDRLSEQLGARPLQAVAVQEDSVQQPAHRSSHKRTRTKRTNSGRTEKSSRQNSPAPVTQQAAQGDTSKPKNRRRRNYRGSKKTTKAKPDSQG